MMHADQIYNEIFKIPFFIKLFWAAFGAFFFWLGGRFK